MSKYINNSENYILIIMHMQVLFVFLFVWTCAQTTFKIKTCMLVCIFNSQSCLCVWSIACVALCIRKCCLCFLFFSTCAQTTSKTKTCRQLWLIIIFNFSKLFVHVVNYTSFIMHEKVRFVFVFFWKCTQTILKTRTCKHHIRWYAFSNYQSCLCVWSITYWHYVYATTVCVFIF